ncbi:hypothetical protein TWF696_009798 [Orbilia brochopaga]|uniref:Uncharacterized protein n=1 Tax=Orbilia brochopaga TaxID=3140254 RepID=A0AAV9UD65_9PEZI
MSFNILDQLATSALRPPHDLKYEPSVPKPQQPEETATNFINNQQSVPISSEIRGTHNNLHHAAIAHRNDQWHSHSHRLYGSRSDPSMGRQCHIYEQSPVAGAGNLELLASNAVGAGPSSHAHVGDNFPHTAATMATIDHSSYISSDMSVDPSAETVGVEEESAIPQSSSPVDSPLPTYDLVHNPSYLGHSTLAQLQVTSASGLHTGLLPTSNMRENASYPYGGICQPPPSTIPPPPTRQPPLPPVAVPSDSMTEGVDATGMLHPSPVTPQAAAGMYHPGATPQSHYNIPYPHPRSNAYQGMSRTIDVYSPSSMMPVQGTSSLSSPPRSGVSPPSSSAVKYNVSSTPPLNTTAPGVSPANLKKCKQRGAGPTPVASPSDSPRYSSFGYRFDKQEVIQPPQPGQLQRAHTMPHHTSALLSRPTPPMSEFKPYQSPETKMHHRSSVRSSR